MIRDVLEISSFKDKACLYLVNFSLVDNSKVSPLTYPALDYSHGRDMQTLLLIF